MIVQNNAEVTAENVSRFHLGIFMLQAADSSTRGSSNTTITLEPAGAAAGSAFGSGSGNGAAIAGGLIAGVIVGAIAEQAMKDRTGMEYTVVLESGVVLTVAQEMGSGDQPINAGDRVIVQNSGGYQRVLPASNLPTAIQRPKGIKIIDGPQP